MNPKNNEPKFELGKIVATHDALKLIRDIGIETVTTAYFLDRHVHGDWGDMTEDDKEENERALKKGYRIVSSYATPEGNLLIITEHDRSITTLLVGSDY